MDFPHSSVSKESTCNAGICLQCKGPTLDPWVWKIPWRRKLQAIPGFLPGKSHGQRSLVGYIVHGVAKVGHNLTTKPLMLSIKLNKFTKSIHLLG